MTTYDNKGYEGDAGWKCFFLHRPNLNIQEGPNQSEYGTNHSQFKVRLEIKLVYISQVLNCTLNSKFAWICFTCVQFARVQIASP